MAMEPSLIETSLDWCDEDGEFGGVRNENVASLSGMSGSGAAVGESIMDSSSLYTPISLFSNEHEQGTTDDDNLSTNFSTDSLDRLHPLYEAKRHEYQLTFDEGSNLNTNELLGTTGTTTATTTMLNEKESKNNRNKNLAGTRSENRNQNQNQTTTTTLLAAANKNLLAAAAAGPQPPESQVVLRRNRPQPSASNPPVVVRYPNYALPDLTFLQTSNMTKLKLAPYTITPSSPSDVSMTSVSSGGSGRRYPTPVSGFSTATSGCSSIGGRTGARGPTPGTSGSGGSNGLNGLSRYGATGRNRPRPLSCNDLEMLKSKVVDWDSLCFLLPPEVKQMFGVQEKKTKRFSLQEPIQEDILELTTDLEKNLGLYEGLVGPGGASGSSSGPICGDSDYEPVITSLINSVSASTAKLPRIVKSHRQLSTIFSQLYTLLASGLQPSLNTLFGAVHNTVWRAIEASVVSGQLQELVMRINSEESVEDGPVKVGCFLRGLMNLSLLPTYLSYLRTKERVLRMHYTPMAFMYLSNTSTRSQYDRLLKSLQELQCKSRFELDIFEEAKEVILKIRVPSGKSVGREYSGKSHSRTNRTASARHSYAQGRMSSGKSSSNNSSQEKYFYGGYSNYSNQMKRSYSEDEMQKVTAASRMRPRTAIPKSQTQYAVNAYAGLEKGMRETDHSGSQGSFYQLKQQWEQMGEKQSRIPRLVSPGYSSSSTGRKYSK